MENRCRIFHPIDLAEPVGIATGSDARKGAVVSRLHSIKHIAVTTAGLAAVLAGCGSSNSQSGNAKHGPSAMSSMSMSSSGPATKSDGSSITVKGFVFTVPASVAPGAKLSVINADSVAHTVTLKTAKLDVKIAASGKATLLAPKTPGTYPITCDYHPTMHGNLVVR